MIKQTKIKRIFIHCSDSPFTIGNQIVDVDVIRAWHLKRGFEDIGYHQVILEDGEIQEGRPEDCVPAGQQGHNKESLAVCLIGQGYYTVKQMCSLRDLLKLWMKRYDLTVDNIFGHYQVNPDKTCPMMKMEDLKRLLF